MQAHLLDLYLEPKQLQEKLRLQLYKKSLVDDNRTQRANVHSCMQKIAARAAITADVEHISTTQMLAVHICNENTIYTKLLRFELPNHPVLEQKFSKLSPLDGLHVSIYIQIASLGDVPS